MFERQKIKIVNVIFLDGKELMEIYQKIKTISFFVA